MPSIDYQNIQVPFLYMHRHMPEGNPNQVIFDSLANQDAYKITLHKFGHIFFGGSFWILLSDHDASNSNAVKATQQEINIGYRLLSEYVLNFFDGYLNHNQSSIHRLKTMHKQRDIPVAHHRNCLLLVITS